MRVLGVLGYYPPNCPIGAFLATHRFLSHLAGLGHDVQVVTQARGDARTIDGVNVRPLGSVDALAEVQAADAMLSHLGDDDKAAATAAGYGKPMIRMVHGGHTGNMPCKLTRFVSPALTVFNSQSFLDESRYTGNSIVCYPMVDGERFRTTPGDRITLINLSESKGGTKFDAIARQMTDHQFLGVKGGHGAQQAVRHPNVDVIGSTSNMRDDVYARTRILLMPSDAETFGMVGVEAMASGIPVIAAPTPGLIESLGPAGIFVDRNDAKGWVNAIERLDDPSEYELASKKALARFDELEIEMRAGLDRFADAVEGLA